MRWRVLFIVALMAFLSACAHHGRPSEGRVAFTFRDWAGPDLTVYGIEPDAAPLDAPVVIVMHGTRRNGEDYRDNWVALAQRHGLRVYVPEFDATRFPGAAHYNLGGAGAPGTRAFDAIEPLYDHIHRQRGSDSDGYVIFGHSAGAQFVHRFLCFARTPNLRLAIAANAGWYTVPAGQYPWPYSLSGAPGKACSLDTWLRKPMIVALGENDTDPDHKYLRRTREAMAQGPHRFARGLYFMHVARALSEAAGSDLGWTLRTVEDAGHDNGAMAIAAADWITDPALGARGPAKKGLGHE